MHMHACFAWNKRALERVRLFCRHKHHLTAHHSALPPSPKPCVHTTTIDASYIYVCIYMCIFIYIHIHTHVYMCVCSISNFSLTLDTYIHICVCMFIHVYLSHRLHAFSPKMMKNPHVIIGLRAGEAVAPKCNAVHCLHSVCGLFISCASVDAWHAKCWLCEPPASSESSSLEQAIPWNRWIASRRIHVRLRVLTPSLLGGA